MDLSLRVRARSRRGGFAQVMGTAQSSTQVYSYLIVDIYDGIITGAGHGSVCVGVGVGAGVSVSVVVADLLLRGWWFRDSR